MEQGGLLAVGPMSFFSSVLFHFLKGEYIISYKP